MKKGYLKLIGSQIDTLHYICIDGIHYSLTFNDSSKIYDIKDGHEMYIDYYELNQALENRMGPYSYDQDKLSDEERALEIKDAHLIEVEVCENEAEIEKFQLLSEEHDFNYFPSYEDYAGELALLIYTIIK